MPSYTLIYFPVRGRAEPIRLLLSALGVPFDEQLVARETWLQFKTEMPLGQVPVLVESEGLSKTLIPQTQAILRHLGRTHGAYGTDEGTMMRCDIVAETVLDVRLPLAGLLAPNVRGKDPAALKLCFEQTLPPLLSRLSTLYNGPYFTGETLVWADCAAYDVLDNLSIISPDILKNFSELNEFMGAMRSHPALQNYLAQQRPSELAPLRQVLETGIAL